MEVIRTPDLNYLDGLVNTFGNIVYICPIHLHLDLLSDLDPVSLNILKLITDLYFRCSAGHAADIWYVADWFHKGPKPPTRWSHPQPTRPGGEIHRHANWLCRANGGFAFCFQDQQSQRAKRLHRYQTYTLKCVLKLTWLFPFYILEWLPLPSVW